MPYLTDVNDAMMPIYIVSRRVKSLRRKYNLVTLSYKPNKLIMSLIILSVLLLSLNVSVFNAVAQQPPTSRVCERCVVFITGSVTAGNSINTGGNSINTGGMPGGQNSINTGGNLFNSGNSTPTVGNSTPTVGNSTPTVGNSTPTVGNSTPTVGTSAQVNSVYSEYNVWRNGQRGQVIHVDFNVQGMLGKVGLVAAYFFYRPSAEPVRSSDPGYNINGILAVSRHIIPSYENTSYNNFQLFIPYNEWVRNLTPPYASLQYTVCVWDLSSNPTLLNVSTSVAFWWSSQL
jgi:hypothetical protein